MKRVKKSSFKRLILAGLCLYVAFTFIKQEVAIRELRQEKTKKQAELKSLEAEAGQIKKKIDNKEDIVYIERIARDELDMVRPNEIIYEDVNRAEKRLKSEE